MFFKENPWFFNISNYQQNEECRNSETSNDDESDLYEEDEKEGISTTYFSPFRDHFFDIIK